MALLQEAEQRKAAEKALRETEAARERQRQVPNLRLAFIKPNTRDFAPQGYALVNSPPSTLRQKHVCADCLL